VHEAELAMRMLAAKLAVTLHCGSTVRTCVDHCDAIEDAMIVLAMSLERLDHEPSIGMRRADLAPSVVSTTCGQTVAKPLQPSGRSRESR
jgi:hypothetical protein